MELIVAAFLKSDSNAAFLSRSRHRSEEGRASACARS
jgi:hypothetical protein